MNTIVLVHGGWHGPWCWSRLIEALGERGVRGVPVALTSSGNDAERLGGLKSDVALVRAAVTEAAADGPVALLGHSYGGLVVSEAAVEHEGVGHLIFCGAFVPRVGDSMRSITGGGKAPWLHVDETGLMTVEPGWPTKLFYSDCDTETASWAESQLTGQAAWSFGDVVDAVAYTDKPSTSIVTTLDQAVSPEAQRTWAEPMSNRVEIDSGHSPFLSQPTALAEILVAELQPVTSG